MKILSIDNFTTKLLSKLLSDFYIRGIIQNFHCISTVFLLYFCCTNTVYIYNVNIFKPSLSMNIFYIDNFTTKLLSKLLSDLYIGGTRY